jgi:hypothetical protein
VAPRAHTAGFFETSVLERFERGFVPHHPAFRALFNSYYQGVGERHPRPQHGLVTRPGLDEVRAYRHAVDAGVAALLHDRVDPEIEALIELGLQPEQRHQELILTDLKHLLSCNPLNRPPRPSGNTPRNATPRPLRRATSSSPARCIRCHRRTATAATRRCSCSATSGSGPPRRTRPTPASGPGPARWASTTASS